MIEREKVIDYLEYHIHLLYDVIPHVSRDDGEYLEAAAKTMSDAITLLKKSFTPEEVYKTVIEHGQHDKRFKLGDKIDYTFMDVVGILNTELMCKAGDM